MSGVRVPPRPPVFPLLHGLLAVAGRWLLVEKPPKNPRKPPGFGVTGRHGDALGERIETGQHGGFVALEEVPVVVEDDGDRRVSGPPGDLLGVGSGGDPQRDGGVAHVVGPGWERGRPPGWPGSRTGSATRQPAASRRRRRRTPAHPRRAGCRSPGGVSSSVAMVVATGTVRGPALVLGAPRTMWPWTSTAFSTTRMVRASRSTWARRRPASSPRRSPQ